MLTWKTHMTIFRFGIHGELKVPSSEEISVISSSLPVGQPLDNVSDAVSDALQDPIEFPSFDRMVLPDDSVAIALQPGLPCATELIAGAVKSVMASGVPPELITIVRGNDDKAVSNEQLLAAIDTDIAGRLKVVFHDPKDREQLCFLGATKKHEAIYINRYLADAAVVLPIGVLDDTGSVHDGWYPVFADKESMVRCQAGAGVTGSIEDDDSDITECDEVGWMLGVQFVVQIVPAGNNQAMHVLAGLSQPVFEKGKKLLRKIWDFELDEEVGLVVAGIGGGAEQQTWDNVTKTIIRLLPAVQTDGAIAVCSELCTKPGPAIRGLADAAFDDESEDLNAVDAGIRSRLTRALQQIRVYLLSDLAETDVENVGVAYVSDAREITKLASQFESCLTLENAQHVNIKRKQAVDQ